MSLNLRPSRGESSCSAPGHDRWNLITPNGSLVPPREKAKGWSICLQAWMPCMRA